jgi:hypothetical protein
LLLGLRLSGSSLRAFGLGKGVGLGWLR